MNTLAETRASSIGLSVLASILFAVALTQPPVFYSNQNQYYLHGLAAASTGDLASDWLANTKDSTPVFSWAVSVFYPLTGPLGVYAVFFMMAMIYFLSLRAIVAAILGAPCSRNLDWCFSATMIVLHSGIVRWTSVTLVGVDYPWFFQAGVANQYILGAGLQPSVFGTLLLTAIACFAHGKHWLAALFIALTCTLHSTYLLPSACLVVGMMLRLWQESGLSKSIRFGLAVLAGILPVTIAAAIVFRPTDAETFAEGQRIIAWVRIPHHCDAARWLDLIAWLQVAWIVLGVALMGRSASRLPLAVAVTLAFGLCVLQILTHHTTLALLFPWRLSAVLVPLATAVLLARFVSLFEKLPGWIMQFSSLFLIVGAAAGGVWIDRNHLAYQVSSAEDGLQDFVKSNRKPGEVYLLPAGFPKPPAKPGSASASFVPVSQTGRPALFELQRFRLITGAAAYVDFKSIPYADTDIIEWHHRVKNCVRWYGTEDWDSSRIIEELKAAGISHVVIPEGVTVRSTRLHRVFADSAYRIFHVD